MDEKKTVSLMGKIGSVVMLFIGSLIISGVLEDIFIHWKPMAYVIPMLILSGLLIWGGVVVWYRWRIALGVVWTVLGAKTALTPFMLQEGIDSKQRLSGIKSDFIIDAAMLKAAMLVGTICLSIGIILIVWQKYRDRKERRISKTESHE